ncbi:hypothetical protein DL96DRAFT_1623320 [Flagelloscypha sp. PMI_526]|nr:hypothetical protein DL96DRAFT_1623320 [Flagelloscypha sp. PMI_526]
MNSNMPACRLPAEIICSILLLHRDLCLVEPDKSGPNSVPWISPSQTCSLWRATALDCPILWDTLLLYNGEATETLLSRSKDVPIHVGRNRSHPSLAHRATWNAHTEAITNSFLIAFQYSHRIATLNFFILFGLNWEDYSFEYLKVAFTEASFPALRSLGLSIEGGNDTLDLLAEWLTPLFAGLLSPPGCSLTHLNLDGSTPCSVWSTIQTSTLRELQWIGREADIVALLQVSKHNPNLENLHLFVVAFEECIDWPVHQPVSLPNLRELIVMGTLSSGALHILQGIEAKRPPPLLSVKFSISIWDQSVERLSSIARYISSLLVGPQKVADLTLRSVSYYWKEMENRIQFSRPSHPRWSNLGHNSLNEFVRMARVDGELDDRWPESVFSLRMFTLLDGEYSALPDMLLCLLPLTSQIDSMHLDLSKFHTGYKTDGLVPWIEFSARFNMLTRLYIALAEDDTSIFNALVLPGLPAWPRLEEISIDAVDDTVQFWLKPWLQQRKAGGYLLQKLTIKTVWDGEGSSQSRYYQQYFDGLVSFVDVLYLRTSIH